VEAVTVGAGEADDALAPALSAPFPGSPPAPPRAPLPGALTQAVTVSAARAALAPASHRRPPGTANRRRRSPLAAS